MDTFPYIPLAHPVEPKDISLVFDGDGRDKVVLVPGMLSFDTFYLRLPGRRKWTLADYWADVRDIVEDPIVVSPSSFGSLHDRAVEIFYQLKGGRVNYGREHSDRFRHNQFGETYNIGLVPDWNEANPIVFIAKGSGATTALHLQYLLAKNFFDQNTSGKWIKGIICLSAPHRGSVMPYAFGLQPGSVMSCVSGHQPGSKPIIHPFSLLQLFLSIIHVICYFKFLEKLFSLQLNDKWSLSNKWGGGKQTFLGALCARSDFVDSGDNFLLDWPVEGARARYTGNEKQLDERYQLDSHCVYINYITTGWMWRSNVTGHFWPRLSWRNVPTAFVSIILGRYKLSSDAVRNVIHASEDLWENDGTLAVKSQVPPPHQRVKMNIVLPQKLFDPVDHELEPGVWYNVYVADRSNTVLFDTEPFFFTNSIVSQLIESAAAQRFNEFLSRHHVRCEYHYVRLVEFIERGLQLGREMVQATDAAANQKFSTGHVPDDVNSFTITDRIEKRVGDKAAIEWIERVDKEEVLKSPSRVIYMMNNFQKATSSATSSIKENLSSADLLVNTGSTFVKPRTRVTIDEYRPSITFSCQSNGLLT